jgi:hypothetical protein
MKTSHQSQILKSFFMILTFALFALQASAQYKVKVKPMIGIGGYHNFQTESNASEVRMRFHMSGNLYAVPRFSYYFPGNKIHEYYAGADLHYHLSKRGKLQPYLLGGLYFNNWINHEQYGAPTRQKFNIAPEAGCGILFNVGCRIKPYIEYRYDIRWREASLGAGLYLSFGKCPKKNKFSKCAAYQ